jgi:DNA-binding MarR family transcriptional regulator
MLSALQRALNQNKPFNSAEQEAFVGLQYVAQRLLDSWTIFLRNEANLTPNQYNVLRILRGADPEGLARHEISERMISREPDVTRLVDRLVAQGLANSVRRADDRRCVQVSITEEGLAHLRFLDKAAAEMPKRLLSRLGKERLRDLNGLLAALIEEGGADR